MRVQNSTSSLEIICSESVRLVSGSSMCSGRLEVRSNQSWSSVCKGGFDWQDAEVVCREISCGDLLKFLWEPYESKNPPKGRKEFKCRGNETTLLDCDTDESKGETCSFVKLDCSMPVNVSLTMKRGHSSLKITCSENDDVSVPDDMALYQTVFLVRLVGVLLTVASLLTAICYSRKATRGQQPAVQENIELDYYNLAAS
ncbi:scavenger receptor cysteine-rich type 1 protein M130-like [Labrus bergylta]|uniref:scavenger receptor cysteine-rich type 1 protein M130-like n=1 Tax=Labrus bergylta TaxID=56723 RepID=UPI0033144680